MNQRRFQRTARRLVAATVGTLLALPAAATMGSAQPSVDTHGNAQGKGTQNSQTPGPDNGQRSPGPRPGGSLVGDANHPPEHPGHPEDDDFSVLVFSKTAGFRHGSIPFGIAAIEELGEANHFAVDATEDSTQFTDENLAQYDAVIWLSTTGNVLNDDEQGAFERYIQAGGGYVGIHAASDTEYDWPWYGELVGAYFAGHPQNQTATIKVEDHAHPSTNHLEDEWERYDEWYNFQSNPRGEVHVLASLDETSYDAGGTAMGHDHPIAWCQNYDGGRAWYTGGGHTNESFSEPEFREHLLGGIQTAAGAIDSDCGASLDESFEKVTLDSTTNNPMELAVAEDGRVLYVDRNGAVRLVRQDGTVTTAGTIPVYTGQEFGLLGLALDPAFTDNGWVYLYYSPVGSDHIDRLSRFTLTGDVLDVGSEVTVLEVDTQRDQCCHAGGALEFDGNGDLYITVGDLTNPFASDGYTPIDEREGRAFWDAQRTSADSSNLAGKILRIHPEEDGSYSIPDGNMFEEGTELTRPEIFAMGFRNPFRIGIDPATDTLLVADYGPDAGQPNPNRGPNATVEWNIVDEPGFYGWPYCVGDNTPYIDYDFETGTSGDAFDCEGGVVNDSPNNEGIQQLPPAIPAEVWYGNLPVEEFPELGTGGAPMAGGVYRHDPESTSDTQWPAYWDGKAIFGEWNQGNLYSFQMNEAGDDLVDINQILTSFDFKRPHALQWGPDGSLYLIEWGSGFGGNNADSGVYRIDYAAGNRAPVIVLDASPTSGALPLEVTFSAAESYDPEGADLTFAWDFTSDGETDATEPEVSHTYTEAGNYTATVTVTDADGRSSVAQVEITAGNTAPELNVVAPVDGGFFNFGDTIAYEVTATDVEDGDLECESIVTQPALGHDEHSHGYEQYYGCSGEFPLPGDEGHIGANIFGVVTMTVTDNGAPGVNPLTTQEVLVLQPKTREAEHFDFTGGVDGDGVSVEDTGDEAGGGQNITDIADGDYWGWDPMNLTNIDEISLRAASADGGATVEVRTGAQDGPVVATIDVGDTGDAQVYDEFTAAVDLGGEAPTSGPLYFVKTSGQLNVNWIEFIGRGVTENSPPSVEISATPTSGEAPLTVAFEGTATDPDGDEPLTYEWDFGDGASSAEAVTEHTYTEVGVYEAVLTVTDPQGAEGSASVEITVGLAPPECDPDVDPGVNDEFDGTELDRCRWSQIVRHDPALYEVAHGALRVETPDGDIYGSDNGTPSNLFLQPVVEGDWTIETLVDASALNEQYQQAGLMVYLDDDNYVKFDYLTQNSPGSAVTRSIELRSEIDGVVQNPQPNAADITSGIWHLRLTKSGSEYTGSYSGDGETWIELPQPVSNPAVSDVEGVGFGLFALGTAQTESQVVAFDHFTLLGGDDDDVTPPELSVSVSPEEPASGWWNGPVTITAEATDDSDGEVYIEYRINGGDWSEYTTPVIVEEQGESLVELRASDVAGNVSDIAEVEVRIDSEGPELVVNGITNGTLYGDSRDLFPRWTATDEGSGIDRVVGRLNGDVIQSGRTLVLHELPLGMHELVVVAFDEAGNRTVQRVTFFVTTSFEDMLSLVVRFEATGRINGPTADVLEGHTRSAFVHWANGRAADAIAELELLKVELDARVDDPGVHATLLRDADAMIERMGGTPTAAADGVAANQGRSLAGTGRVPGDPTRMPGKELIVPGQS